jgi:queuosine precursor transporter
MEMNKEKSCDLQTLYQIISAAFCTIVVISNIISAKMIALPYVDFSIPAGLITYPLTFILSDVVTEIFGAKKAKLMVYIALVMSVLSFVMIHFTLMLPTDILETETAFQSVLGLSGLRIFSSLTAYIIAQVADIQLYAWIKRWTSPRFLWLRNNGSTCISQMIDTVVIDTIFLYWGLEMSLVQIMPIMVFSYAYKVFFSIACTPLFYLFIFMIRGRGKESSSPLQNLSLNTNDALIL